MLNIVRYNFKSNNGLNTACLWLLAGVVNDAVQLCVNRRRRARINKLKLIHVVENNDNNNYFSRRSNSVREYFILEHSIPQILPWKAICLINLRSSESFDDEQELSFVRIIVIEETGAESKYSVDTDVNEKRCKKYIHVNIRFNCLEIAKGN